MEVEEVEARSLFACDVGVLRGRVEEEEEEGRRLDELVALFEKEQEVVMKRRTLHLSRPSDCSG